MISEYYGDRKIQLYKEQYNILLLRKICTDISRSGILKQENYTGVHDF